MVFVLKKRVGLHFIFVLITFIFLFFIFSSVYSNASASSIRTRKTATAVEADPACSAHRSKKRKGREGGREGGRNSIETWGEMKKTKETPKSAAFLCLLNFFLCFWLGFSFFLFTSSCRFLSYMKKFSFFFVLYSKLYGFASFFSIPLFSPKLGEIVVYDDF